MLSELLTKERQRQSSNNQAVQELFKEPLAWAQQLVTDLNAEGVKATLIINNESYSPAVFELREFTIPVATIVIDGEEDDDERRVDIYGPAHAPRYGLLQKSEHLLRANAETITEKVRVEFMILSHEVNLRMRKFHSKEEVEMRLKDYVLNQIEVRKSNASLPDLQTVREIALNPDIGNPPAPEKK